MAFKLTQEEPHRSGKYDTRNGSFLTPCFAPDATRATIKHLTPEDFKNIGLEMILTNTYHLMLKPGEDIIKKAGGAHKYIVFDKPILTDSGGFQAFSLVHRSKLGKITDEGVEFRSHIDGSKYMLTPERSMEIQYALGSDIMMVLDEPAPWPATRRYAKESMNRTFDWAKRSQAKLAELTKDDPNPPDLWGIVQGSIYDDLREESAEQIMSLDFKAYAIGGLSFGEPDEHLYRVAGNMDKILPKDKPRYLMGIGTPENIRESIKVGVDVFDSVMPTRNARHGYLFSSEGIIRIKNEKYKEDFTPLDPNCDCYACTGGFTRSYLRHLANVDEPLGRHLFTIHNLTFYQNLVKSYQD